jgi:hypothetical protein
MSRWLESLDERQRQEIAFCRVYRTQFGHGTDGHNAKLIIALCADMLDGYEATISALQTQCGVSIDQGEPPDQDHDYTGTP